MTLLNGLKCSVFMLLMCFALCVNGVNARRTTVDLAGEWKFSTSLAGDSAITVKLPGTTDTNGVGVINDNHGETLSLPVALHFRARPITAVQSTFPPTGRVVT